MKRIFQGIITAVFIIILIFILERKQTSSHKSRPHHTGPIQRENVTIAKSLFEKLEDETRNMSVERDPFSFPVEAAAGEKEKKIYLTGIVLDDNQPAAIINNVIVTVGNTIEGRTVKAIQKDRVILEKDGQEMELFIGF